jgi:hypothetical protein
MTMKVPTPPGTALLAVSLVPREDRLKEHAPAVQMDIVLGGARKLS